MRRRIIIFATLLASAILIMKLNINATSSCSSPPPLPPITYKYIDVIFGGINTATSVASGFICTMPSQNAPSESWKNYLNNTPEGDLRFKIAVTTVTTSDFYSKNMFCVSTSNVITSKSYDASDNIISDNFTIDKPAGKITIKVPSNRDYKVTFVADSPFKLFCNVSDPISFNYYIYEFLSQDVTVTSTDAENQTSISLPEAVFSSRFVTIGYNCLF